MSAVGEIIDEPVENVVRYIHWHNLLDEGTVSDSIKGSRKIHEYKRHVVVFLQQIRETLEQVDNCNRF